MNMIVMSELEKAFSLALFLSLDLVLKSRMAERGAFTPFFTSF